MTQDKQDEWRWQWDRFYDENLFLFKEWIHPTRLEDFREKSVLDCGCGNGQYINIIAPYCKRILGVDLNAAEIARTNTAHNTNVEIIEADITTMNLKKNFDIVYSIGVLHHTDNPTNAFNNIKRFVKKGGRLIVWVYSREGNFLNMLVLEPIKELFFRKLDRKFLLYLAHALTIILYMPIYTLYLLPLRFLPYYQYFQNWRKLSYKRNFMNVFDKLNAPTTHFIGKETVEKWFDSDEFKDVHISLYKGVSWRASGTKR
ncbi:MAG: class I SAM-dependent methyltransferase [Candidatus Altiarchaeota archaeon]|nr:class I SAM-dependent methyltransferase [Candidatus Altiarchaeota archaeon]